MTNSYERPSNMLYDALSDALAQLRPIHCLSAGLRAGGAWSLRFAAPDGIKFNTVLSGHAWVWVDGVAPIRLEEGDCFLLTKRRPFHLASAPDLPPEDAEPIYATATDGVATCGTGKGFFLVGGRFAFDEDVARLVFDPLPPILAVSTAEAEAPVLRWALTELRRELAARALGGALMTDTLGQIMLVQVLRLHARTAPGGGLIGALADPRIGRAVNLVHREPAARWTLARLSAEAGMSRSAFAARFAELLGQPPASYVRRWRMILARQMLQAGDAGLDEIAARLGYGSASAFGIAFAKEVGASPGRWRVENGATRRPSSVPAPLLERPA